MDKKALLIKTMISYYANDPCRIQHFIKVHDFAGVIGKLGMRNRIFLRLPRLYMISELR